MPRFIAKIGVNSIYEEGGLFYVKSDDQGLWAFHLKTVAAARKLARQFASGARVKA